MRYLKIITAILIIFCAAAAAGGASAQDQGIDDRIGKKESELDNLRRQINEQRKKIRDLEKQEKSVTEYLRKLEGEESLMRQLLGGLDDKKEMLEQQVSQLRIDLEQSEAEYAQRLQVLAKRLREMYKDGPRHAWMELLAAEDVSDLLQKYKFLSLIAERDAALIDDVKGHKEQVELQEAEITELLHQVIISRNEKASEVEKLEENRRKRRRILSGLQADKKKYEKRVGELAAAERQLQSFIEELEKARLEQSKAWGEYGEANFPGLKGKMERPVEGSTSRRFGSFKHPEFGTVTYNTGIDIATRQGEPVRAVARGRVEFSGVLAGYGNCIIINHGGGYYSLYAHASQIFVAQGVQVERGGLIAETGEETPGAGGSLHFEIRQSKRALDPEEWFRKGGK